ncbi:lipase family protein [Aestuariirhabdus sp. LZHN29]|uniref:lipase family protein n=1 Tax=Aestuariirhabdus sp. LZHN29 TaxID=3417462 RepID=UPI003CF89F64
MTSMISELMLLSVDVYNPKDINDNSVEAPLGWDFIPNVGVDNSGRMYHQDSGFYAYALTRSGPDGPEAVIAFRGTDQILGSGTDMGVDWELSVSNGYHPQFEQALQFTLDVFMELAQSAGRSPLVYVTGHSLGGALAQIVSSVFALPGYTFDAPGALSLSQELSFIEGLFPWFNDNAQILNLFSAFTPEFNNPGDLVNISIIGSAISAASGDVIGSHYDLLSDEGSSLVGSVAEGLAQVTGGAAGLLGLAAVAVALAPASTLAVAGVLGIDTVLKHSSEAIRNLVVGLDQQGQLIPRLVESTHFPNGIEGYQPPSDGVIGMLKDVLGTIGQWFTQQLSQQDAVALLNQLDETNSGRIGALATQYDVSIDHLRMATQTITESEWSETLTPFAGYHGELLVTLERATETTGQLLDLEMPGVTADGHFTELAIVGAASLDWSQEGYRIKSELGKDEVAVTFRSVTPLALGGEYTTGINLVYSLYGRSGENVEGEQTIFAESSASPWHQLPEIDTSIEISEDNPRDLMGDDANNRLTGDLAENTLLGLRGDDELLGEGGRDTLIGGYGNDLLQGGVGRDLLIGGDGDDRLIAGSLDSLKGGQSIDPDDLTLGDFLSGQQGDDLLFGSGYRDFLGGGAGDDLLYGGEGTDYLMGDGDWTLGNPDWTVNEQPGKVNIVGDIQWSATAVVGGDDVIWGGGGNDFAWGGDGDDLLYGEAGNDVLMGEAGDDTLLGGIGDDRLLGEAGDDLVVGGEGLNQLNGDAPNLALEEHGDDLVIGGNDRDLIWGDGGNDRLYGNGGDDQIQGDNALGASGNDYLSGGAGSDYLLGQLGNDELHGDEGDDALVGGDGNDRLYGGKDDDELEGGAGDDYLEGGSGHDWLIGGAGFDVLVGGSGQDELSDTRGGGLLVGEGGYDTYDVRSGQDAVSIMDLEENRLKFGDLSYAQGMNRISLSQGSLLISIDGRPIAHLANFDPNDVYAGSGITDVEFSDGTTINYLQLLQLGITSDGTSADDTLWGTNAFDRMNGYAGNDTLYGLEGDDILDGGTGSDHMVGMTGDDTYRVDNLDDRVAEELGEGVDTVEASIDYQLTDHVEHLRLLEGVIRGSGNALDNILMGNHLDNQLYGGAGNDSLVGDQGDDLLDGGAGADTLAGGVGNDTYIVDDAGDSTHDVMGGGDDRIMATADHHMGSHIEQLSMLGSESLSAWGNGQDNDIEGNSGDNSLNGGAGNDQLFGGAGNDLLDGGAGVDRLVGGEGDDRYRITDALDAVIEQVDGGTDRAEVFVEGYRLDANLEQLELADGVYHGVGNELDNLLIGNALGNTLDGGLGGDLMLGGEGNDIYSVDNADDQVVELFGEGQQDSVITTVDYQLAENVENLRVASAGGTNAVGNSLANRIEGHSGDDSLAGGGGNDQLFGYSGNDQLDGGSGDDLLDGGLGVDQMHGGSGDDRYRVDNTLDQAIEAPGEGLDRVVASVSYQLSAGIEELELVGWSPLDGVGNELNNLLIGNAYQNHLQGLAGDDLLVSNGGADLLEGGAGNDTYRVQGEGVILLEQPDAGYDEVLSEGGLVLADHVEALRLVGSGDANGTGNSANNMLSGNDDRNRLEGLAGDDVLNGHSGDDHLLGGTGDDRLFGGEDPEVVERGDGDEGEEGEHWENESSQNPPPRQAWSNSDLLDGGEGNDYLDGGSGDDLLLGGSGDDHLFGGDDGGTLINSGGSGLEWNPEWDNWGNEASDWGGSEEEAVLSNNDQLFGGAGNDLLQGGSGDDRLDGGAGIDSLYGGEGLDHLDGGDGIDLLAGGDGDDTYIVDGYRVERVEWVQAGEDVRLSLRLDCTTNLSLTHEWSEKPWSTKGNEGLGNGWDAPPPGHDLNQNDGYPHSPGNPGARNNPSRGDVTKSQSHLADDRCDVNGSEFRRSEHNGTKNDMSSFFEWAAKSGNQTVTKHDLGYYDAPTLIPVTQEEWVSDSVWEEIDSGYDRVFASVSFELPEHVETLTLTGNGNIDATGNRLANSLWGNSGNNLIDGGTGSDEMMGGLGDDRYRVEDTGDRVVELSDEGTDWVETSIDYTLANQVENLQLLGEHNLVGVGNELSNQLIGNDGDNRLQGGTGDDYLQGGLGDDHLQGGTGDDVYRYGLGDGFDQITDEQGHNRILFGGAINANQVVARRDDATGDLTLQITNTAGVDYLGQGLWMNAASAASLDVIEFADGTQASWNELKAQGVTLRGGNGKDRLLGTRGDDRLEGGRGKDWLYGGIGYDRLMGGDGDDLLIGAEGDDLLRGGTGTDQLIGGCGDDLLEGGVGDDQLVGGAGDDSYQFNPGFGQDVLYEIGGADGGHDRVVFSQGIDHSALRFANEDGDLLISILEQPDQLLVKGWYDGDAQPGMLVERFETSDGRSLQHTQVEQLVHAMAAMGGTEGVGNLLPGSTTPDLSAEIAAAWQDSSVA